MPALNISALQSYPRSFNISGATYPGDPHRIFSEPFFVEAESPKSTILRLSIDSFLKTGNHENNFIYLKSIFSGFRSLCTIFFECMATNARIIHLIITAASLSQYYPFWRILSNSSPPLRCSNTK